MHELSIAVELMGQLEALAAERDLERIEEITIEAGAMRQIVPEALDLAFAAVADGTCAAGANVHLEIVPALVRCRSCEHEFEPGADLSAVIAWSVA